MDIESWRKKVERIEKFVACTKENGVRAKITIVVKNTRRIEFEKAKKDENCQELSGCWNLAKSTSMGIRHLQTHC